MAYHCFPMTFLEFGVFFFTPFPIPKAPLGSWNSSPVGNVAVQPQLFPHVWHLYEDSPSKKKHVKSHSTYLWTRFVWRSFEDQIFHETQHPAIGVPHDLGNLQRHPEESAQLLWCPACSKLAADRTTTRTPSAMATILDACSQGGRTGGTSTKCCGL